MPDGLQRQRGFDQGQGRPDRLGCGRAAGRAPAGAALAKNAPHPHAALLFADFILSAEGQKLLADMGRVPSSRTQKTLLDQHKSVMIDPIKWIDEAPKWRKVWNELFLQ